MRRLKKLIFGCGFLGSQVASRWLAGGHDVYAVARSERRATELERMGMFPVVADVTRPATLQDLPAADTVLYAVGYDRTSPPSMEEVYAGGVRHVLASLPNTPQSFVYISSTGVYGDATGAWLDEQTPPDPQREGGRAALAAEDALRASHLASRAIVLRMAGLYGPGRIPFLDKLRRGDPIPAAQEGWLNLIHVEDAATAVLEAVARFSGDAPAGPHVLNVTDGHPVQRVDYYREVARLTGAAPPRFESPDPASPRAARAATNRRISNARLLSVVDLRLAYPTFREGLASILSREGGRDGG